MKDFEIFKMAFIKINSYAKINIALNIIKKNSYLHKIETIVAFISLHDDIFIRQIKNKKHIISFNGKFSKKITKNNTVSKLLSILDNRNLLNQKKFQIKINKRIPTQAGLGGGSMNAANILKFFLEKKIIKINKKETLSILKIVGSDVIFGLHSTNSILTSKNKIKRFNNCKKFYVLVVKPNFGCSTKYIYSKVRNFNKPKLNNPRKRMFNFDFLKKMNNSLELVALSKYSKLKSIKTYLESFPEPVFVRMTGSGSALVAYFRTKASCHKAKKKFDRKYKHLWSIISKTI